MNDAIDEVIRCANDDSDRAERNGGIGFVCDRHAIDKKEQNTDRYDRHKRKRDRNIKGDSGIAVKNKIDKGKDVRRMAIREILEREEFYCPIDGAEDEDSDCADDESRLSHYISWVSVFLHATQDVDVGRTFRRASSMSCLQYLQVP